MQARLILCRGFGWPAPQVIPRLSRSQQYFAVAGARRIGIKQFQRWCSIVCPPAPVPPFAPPLAPQRARIQPLAHLFDRLVVAPDHTSFEKGADQQQHEQHRQGNQHPAPNRVQNRRNFRQSFLLLTGERIRNATAASPLGLRLPPPSLLRQMPGSRHETLTLSVCIFQKIGTFFANHHAGNARIDANHGRKYGGVCYSQVTNAFDAQLRIDNGEWSVPVSHSASACGMIHRICSPPCIFREVSIVLHYPPRRQFSFDPSF
jgi:hypothetical protein